MMCSFIYTEEGEVLYDRMGTKIVMPGPISSSEFSAPKPNEFVLRQQRQATTDNRTLVPKVTNPLTKLPKNLRLTSRPIPLTFIVIFSVEGLGMNHLI